MKPVIDHLENGLTVVLQENHASPVVAFQMWVGVGSADELKGEEGLAHVFEHMLFKGTKNRAVGEIPQDVERAGGQINAWTSHDETVFHVTLASRYAHEGLDILSDAVQNAALDPRELAVELDVIREEIRMGEDTPQRVSVHQLFGGVFKKHPYGRPVIGYDRTVRKFDRELVHGFYKSWYVPQNMVFVAVGDFEAAAMREAIAKHFGKMRRKKVPARTARAAEPVQKSVRVVSSARPFSEAQLAVGFPIPGLCHPDAPALDLLATILGQGMSSRIETRVRREKGLVSEARSMAHTPKDGGIFGIFAALPPENTVRAVEALCEEMFLLCREPVSDVELRKAKTLLESESVYTEETVDGIARKLGYFCLHTGDIQFDKRYLASMAELDDADLADAARRYLKVERLTLSAVVPDPAVVAPRKKVPWISKKGSSAQLDKAVLDGAMKEKAARQAERKKAGPPARRAEPPVTLHTLPSGDVFIVHPDSTSDLVAVRGAFLGGQRGEPAERVGLSLLMSNVISRGTGRASAREIAGRMDELACAVGGFSGRNTFGISGEFLARSFAEGFELLGDILRDPDFPQNEVDREKQLIVEEIRANQDNPAGQVFEAFHECFFGAHPYGRPIRGTEESVAAMTRDDLEELHRELTKPGRMVMAVVGNVSTTRLLDLAQRFVSPGKGKSDHAVQKIAVETPGAPVQVKRRLPKQQSHIVVGFPGLTLGDERRFALDVLVEILGGHGGRLFDSVREKKGLAYSVTATSLEGLDPGYMAVYAATSPGKERAVVDAMLEVLDGIRTKKPPQEELVRIKRHIIGARSIGMQRSANRAAAMALDHLYGSGHDAYMKYAKEIDRVTAKSVHDLCRDLLDFDKRVVSCVGADVDDLDLL